MTYTYSTGTWIGVATASGVALLDPRFPAVTVRALWDVMAQGQPIGSWLELLAGGGIRSLPGFALVQSEAQQVRVLVRGEATVELDETLIQAQEMSTWREHVASGVDQVVLVGPDGDGERWPVQAGIVFAGTLRAGTAVDEHQAAAGIGGVATYSSGQGQAGAESASAPDDGGPEHDADLAESAGEGSEAPAGDAVVLPPLSIDEAQEMPDVVPDAGSDSAQDEQARESVTDAGSEFDGTSVGSSIGSAEGEIVGEAEGAVAGEGEVEVQGELAPEGESGADAELGEDDGHAGQIESGIDVESSGLTETGDDDWQGGDLQAAVVVESDDEGGTDSAVVPDPDDETGAAAEPDADVYSGPDGTELPTAEVAGLEGGEEPSRINASPPGLVADESEIMPAEAGHVSPASAESASAESSGEEGSGAEAPGQAGTSEESSSQDRGLIDSLPWNVPAMKAEAAEGQDQEQPAEADDVAAAAGQEPDLAASADGAGTPAEAAGEAANDLPQSASVDERPAPDQDQDPATGEVDEAEGDHDGHTVLVSHLRSAFAQDTADAKEGPDDSTIIPGTDDLEEAPAHPELVVSTGQRVVLDRPVLVGRAPETARFEGPVAPRLVTVPSPEQDISRSHVEIRPEGGHVLVTDLRSTNGTVVTLPATEPRRLHPGEVIPIGPGALIDLGDGITMVVETDGPSIEPTGGTGQEGQSFQPPGAYGGDYQPSGSGHQSGGAQPESQPGPYGEQVQFGEPGHHAQHGDHGQPGEPGQHSQHGQPGQHGQAGQHVQPDPHAQHAEPAHGGDEEYRGPAGPQGGAH